MRAILFHSIRLASVLTMLSGASAFAQAVPCKGCRLFLVTWDDAGSYLGHHAIPGVAVEFLPGIGTGDGTCVGNEPHCEPSPCRFQEGKVRIDNVDVDGGIDVLDPDGSHRATLLDDDGAEFPVHSDIENGENIACGSNRIVLRVKAAGDTHNVAVRCTGCPGQDPY